VRQRFVYTELNTPEDIAASTFETSFLLERSVFSSGFSAPSAIFLVLGAFALEGLGFLVGREAELFLPPTFLADAGLSLTSWDVFIAAFRATASDAGRDESARMSLNLQGDIEVDSHHLEL
jgi:hypothetical protein